MNKPKQILADICDVIEALRHEASLCRPSQQSLQSDD